MANYHGFARSNYFKVKDVDALRKQLEEYDLDIKIETDDKNHPGKVTLLVTGGDEAGWPGGYYDNESEYHDLDMAELVASHLVDGEVAILQEVGTEVLRYLVGYAVAVNSKNEQREVQLNQIYSLAGELGSSVTSVAF